MLHSLVRAGCVIGLPFLASPAAAETPQDGQGDRSDIVVIGPAVLPVLNTVEADQGAR